jgi:predicted Fe-Mo cluster-binding NifX family protein
MISCTESTTPEFIRNEELNGRSAVKLLVGQGCTDVILVDIGDGALRHLQAVTMYAWVVPGPVTGREALRMFAEGKLAPVPPVSAAASRGEGHVVAAAAMMPVCRPLAAAVDNGAASNTS